MHNVPPQMEGMLVDIEALTLDPHNARKHSQRNLTLLCSSLRRYGQRRPIVVTEAGVVISGEGVYRAARKLGWTEIAALIVTDNQQEATQWAIVDNRSAELSQWNWDQLAESLQELETASINLDELGFENSELEAIFGSVRNPREEQPRTPREARPVCCPQCQFEFVP